MADATVEIRNNSAAVEIGGADQLEPLVRAADGSRVAAEAAARIASEKAEVLSAMADNVDVQPVLEGPVYAVTDPEGRVLQASYADGRFRTPHFDTGQFYNERTRLLAPASARQPVDLNHFLGWGQSQMGSGNNVYPSPGVDSRDLTFSSGITDGSGSANSFAPMPVIGNSQIMWSAMAQLKFLIAADHGYHDDYRLFASTAFRNGTKLAPWVDPNDGPQEGLNKGQPTYDRMMHQIEEAARLADGAQYIHQVQAFCGYQGNADWATPRDTYRAQVEQLMADVRADVRTRTGQLWQFPFIFIQDADGQADAPANVQYEPTAAAAYYDLVREGKVLISSSAYHVEHSDDRHQTGNGSMQLGQHLGRALYEAVYRGGTWTGLRPREVIRYRRNKALIRFHVPVAPIVFRTDVVTLPPNYGFRFHDDQGGTAIVNQEIVGPDEVLLTFGRDMAGSPEVSYAWYSNGKTASGPKTGPRGCLFDSDTTKGYFINQDAPWDLANPCLRFKEKVL